MSQQAYQDSYNNKCDVEVLEDLNRQLKYMERSLVQHKDGQVKSMRRVKTDMKKKTKENTSLIFDLNVIKFEDKKQSIAQKKKEIELQMLEDKVARLKKDEAALKQELQTLKMTQATGGDIQHDRNRVEQSQKQSEEDLDRERIN